jgi:NADPH2:quinone reductase
MNALVLDRPGPPDTLRVADIPTPEPGAGEVRVRVHAFALNPVDYKRARTGYPTWQYPFVLGLDVAGTIDALGPGVEGWQVGNRVFYHGDLSRPGGYAEYAIAAAHMLVRIPEEVSFVEAAALPTAGFTAYQTLFRRLHVQAGQTVLVTGGAGGVGGFAVQLAAWAGATVITTASVYNHDYLRRLGATHVIDYNTENVVERVLSLTGGRGVDAMVDTLGTESATAGLDMLAFGGGLACVSRLPDFSRIRRLTKALSIHEIFLNGAYLSEDRIAQEDLARIGREMIELVRTRQINPTVSEVISLEAVPEALNRLSQRHVRGKIVARLIN